MASDFDIEKLIDSIVNSRKYRSLYRPTVERIVKDMAKRYPAKRVAKAAKKKLHQIWGAYYIRPDFAKLLSKVKEEIAHGENIKEIMNPLLMLQASTKERLPILGQFYRQIFSVTGTPKTIVEPACGVNALTYYWMDPTTKYTGFDVDQDLNNFINQIFELTGFEKQARVDLGDILITKTPSAEVGFLLKVLTLLEKQKEHCSLQILKEMDCKYLVISFPTHSLSGKEKGMVGFYSQQFLNLVQNEPWSVKKLFFESELIFIIKKHG